MTLQELESTYLVEQSTDGKNFQQTSVDKFLRVVKNCPNISVSGTVKTPQFGEQKKAVDVTEEVHSLSNDEMVLFWMNSTPQLANAYTFRISDKPQEEPTEEEV